jgi:type I site-specific restriction endonuclease
MSTEADTCRKYVFPKLIEAGWDNDPHSFTEQRTFTKLGRGTNKLYPADNPD